jgi:hypothetical protein
MLILEGVVSDSYYIPAQNQALNVEEICVDTTTQRYNDENENIHQLSDTAAS